MCLSGGDCGHTAERVAAQTAERLRETHRLAFAEGFADFEHWPNR